MTTAEGKNHTMAEIKIKRKRMRERERERERVMTPMAHLNTTEA